MTYYKRRWQMKKSPYEDEVVANLRRLVLDSPLSLRERAEAADVLDQIYVPEDIDLLLSVPNSNLRMSKYPVTNTQYELFLNAPDFAEQKYWMNFPRFDENNLLMDENWEDAGWKFLQKNLDKDGKLEPRYWRNPRFGVSRRFAPVVGISWYEANAYCKWLTEHQKNIPKLDTNVPVIFRLPTEKEWVLAAGGDEKDRYAFGVLEDEDVISQYINTSESNIGRTTPVWMYPQGASPIGAMDMAGNVWEWQANFYNKDQDGLALRGGSWDDVRATRVSLVQQLSPVRHLELLRFSSVLCPSQLGFVILFSGLLCSVSSRRRRVDLKIRP